MTNELKKYYFTLLTPSVVILILLYVIKSFGTGVGFDLSSSKTVNVLLFVCSAAAGIAFPVFYRSRFANKLKDERVIDSGEFLKFEKRLITIALMVPYLVVLAVLLNLPFNYSVGIFLIAIYSVYYFYPSRKRIDFDKKIFRVGK